MTIIQIVVPVFLLAATLANGLPVKSEIIERSRRQIAEQTIGSIDGDIFAVARCRVACLFSSQLNNTSSAKFHNLADLMENEDPTASMCWETCQLLIENWWTWHYMCDQYRLCLPGCQKACQFVTALRDSVLAPDKRFPGGDSKKKKQCADTSNIVGFSNIKWTCDAQDTFRGCQVSWGYPLILSKDKEIDGTCSIPPEETLVYVIFYNEDDSQLPLAASSLSSNVDGVFLYKQQTFRAAAMTFESSIMLTNGDENSNNQIQDGPRIATDSQPYQRPVSSSGVTQPRQRRGFFFQIVAVSSLGIVAHSHTLAIRSGTYGLSPPFFPPARLTPTVLLKNIDLGLSAQLSWRYSLPFLNNSTQSGKNDIQLVWRRHSCNVEPTFPTCELIPRTWSVQLDMATVNSGDFYLPNLTYNSAYELYVAMAGANSSRVLITTPGCFSPDRTFRLCLPTTLAKDQPTYESKNVSLIVSLVATSVVVVVTALVVGLFLYFRLYRQSKTTANENAIPNDPALPPLLRPGTTVGNGDDYVDYAIATNYHPRSTGRDSAYDSYVGSVHQLSMMGMFRDQWEISESQLTIQKLVIPGDAIDMFRGVLGRETVWIKRLKSTTTEWRDHFLNELAILKMLERHANVLNVVACITANSSSPPVVVLEYFAYSLSLADYWAIIQRQFLVSKVKSRSPMRRHNRPDIIEDAAIVCENIENEPDIDSLTMSLQPQTQLDFMRQIAAGLAHIHSHQFTHGCLEPYTSILISVEASLVKITGIGSSSNLAKFVNSAHPEYHIERYLSPECGLANPIRTKQGDVWSFAIICWQMASFGAPPYLEIAPEKLAQCVTSGFKLEQPAAASNKLYELLLRCWDSLPHRRPTFQDVLVDLHTLLNSNYRHVDHNKILSSAIPVQMITPMMPEPVDPPRQSVADNDSDSVFDGGSDINGKEVQVFTNPQPPAHKSVKIRTPSYNETSLASDHV